MIAPRRRFLKEARTIVPLWLATMAVIVADALTGPGRLDAFALLAYVGGTLALGAHVIGHEYSHRTLAALLSQPIDRSRLLLTKFAVLAPLLLTIGAAFWYLIAYDMQPRPHPAAVFVPIAGGLFVAPWMTMIARNQLGGVMLTAMIGGWSAIAVSVATVKLSGLDVRDAEQLGLRIWLRAVYVFAAVSAVVAWRAFMRLEAIEGGGRQFHLPRLFGTPSTARGGSAVWSLIRKELRLQQLTFALAAIFVAGWMAVLVRDAAAGEPVQAIRPILAVLSVVYLFAVAITAGAVACADERQSGVLESQLLLPIGASRQWVAKAAVAIGLALLLGIGPPALFIALSGSTTAVRELLPPAHLAAVLIFTVTACGLYVSSLASSGVRALTLAFPFVMGMYFTLLYVASGSPLRGDVVVYGAIPSAVVLLVLAAFNYRTVERSYSRALFQVGAAWLFAVAGIPLVLIFRMLTA